jgi:hypothetical protein
LAITTTSTATTAIPELWAAMTQDAREKNLVFANIWNREYENELKSRGYGDTVHIQGISNFTAADGTAAGLGTGLGVGGSLTYTALSFASQINLVIDTHAYKAVDIEHEAELFSNISLMGKASARAGYAVAEKIDTDLAALPDNFSTTVGTLAVSLTDADIRAGVEKLNAAKAPGDGRVYVHGTKQQADHLGVDKYINAQYKAALGSVDTAVFKGEYAHLYGMRWIASTNVEGSDGAGHDNFFSQSDAVAVAILEANRMARFYEIDTDSTKVAVHAIYGAIELRDDHGVFAKGL